jgi:hypothetical protein
MIAAVSPEVSASLEPAAEPTHWLRGRYFVPLPDLSDETRQAINKGRAAATWVEILARLRDLERRGPDDQTKQAAEAGRIEGLGVNGLAAAVGCSHTTALKHLRHLESLGLIRTEQAAFTLEADQVTGRIRRNYAKAPPKVIVVTIEDRHCRPCRASGTRRGDTPGTGPRATGDTPETVRKGVNPQDRNWRVSKERTSKEVRSFGTNKRRTAAGPGKGPAAAAAGAGGQRPAMPAAKHASPPTLGWSSWSDPATCAKGREFVNAIAATLNMTPADVAAVPKGPKRHELIERYFKAKEAAPPEPRPMNRLRREQALRRIPFRVARYAKGLGWSEIEVKALWRVAPKELERLVNQRDLDSPRVIHQGICTDVEPATITLSDDLERARQEALQALEQAAEQERQEQARKDAEWDQLMAERGIRRAADPQPASPEDYAEFAERSEAIMAIREQAEASGDPADLERAQHESLQIVRDYAKKLKTGKAVA